MFACRLAPPELRDAAISAIREFFSHADLSQVVEGGYSFMLTHAGYVGFFQILPPDAPLAKFINPEVPAAAVTPVHAEPAAASTAELPSWLTELERCVYEATTDKEQSAVALARRAGYSVSRTRDAVARMTTCNPPLLMRSSRGVRRIPRAA